jgi:phosphoglycerol transferase
MALFAHTARTNSPKAAECADGALSDMRQRVRANWSRDLVGSLASVVLTLILVIVALQLWWTDLKVPFTYGGDNLVNQMLIQAIMENGWYLTNPRLGMPFPQTMHDFPMADTLHFGFLKLLGYVYHDSAVVLNLYVLLPFLLVDLSAYFVLRRFKVAPLLAVVASVLYACAPYHFCRSQGHLCLAAYYVLPLVTFVVLRIYMGHSPFVVNDPATGQPRWRFFRLEAFGAVLVCLLVSMSGVYYAFFSCFLLLMAGIKAAFRERHKAPLLSAVLLVTVISAGVGAALVPSVLYSRVHGKNLSMGGRLAWEADTFGLNVAEMLLPLPQHRIARLARIHTAYQMDRKVTSEYIFAALGLVASAGFVWLMTRFLWRRPGRVERVEDGLAYLTVCAVLLGTIGGLGALFNFYISPMIRCYNRLSVFIAFFALFGLALSVQRLVHRRIRSRLSRTIYVAGACAVLLLGAVDQTVPWFRPNYRICNSEYASDADFGQQMEAALPAATMVWQMPCISFPEHPTVVEMSDYDLLRPYLHTRKLRFSYGAMRGREAYRFQTEMAKLPLHEVVRQLAFAGFGAIYVDRAGYKDHGEAIKRQLTRLLGAEPLFSLNKRQYCFDMRRYIGELHRWHSDEWEVLRDTALHPVLLTWTCFGHEEKDARLGTFRWCGRRGEVEIINGQSRPRQAVLRMACSCSQDTPARLIIDGDLAHEEVMLTRDPQPLDLKLTVHPGKHVLRFTCDGTVKRLPGDNRGLGFRVWNPEWRVE